MTSLVFKSTQLKATLLGSYREWRYRPDPAKLPSGNFNQYEKKVKEEIARKHL